MVLAGGAAAEAVALERERRCATLYDSATTDDNGEALETAADDDNDDAGDSQRRASDAEDAEDARSAAADACAPTFVDIL